MKLSFDEIVEKLCRQACDILNINPEPNVNYVGWKMFQYEFIPWLKGQAVEEVKKNFWINAYEKFDADEESRKDFYKKHLSLIESDE